MKTLAAAVLAVLLAAGCAGHSVILVAPERASAGNCLDTCAALFGRRPTLTCGERQGPRPVLLCSYEPSPLPGVETPPDPTCRAECARAGIGQIDGCWELKTRHGEPAVACQYKSPFL